MSLYSASVKKPVSTIMIFVGVIIFGIYSYFECINLYHFYAVSVFEEAQLFQALGIFEK